MRGWPPGFSKRRREHVVGDQVRIKNEAFQPALTSSR